MFGQKASQRAPDQGDEMFGAHEKARHGGSEAQVSEVQGEEGEDAGSGTRIQEVEGAGED